VHECCTGGEGGNSELFVLLLLSLLLLLFLFSFALMAAAAAARLGVWAALRLKAA